MLERVNYHETYDTRSETWVYECDMLTKHQANELKQKKIRQPQLKTKFCSLFSWIIEILPIMRLFQKVEQLIKSNYYLRVMCHLRSSRDQIYGQTIYEFWATMTHLIIKTLFVSFSSTSSKFVTVRLSSVQWI